MVKPSWSIIAIHGFSSSTIFCRLEDWPASRASLGVPTWKLDASSCAAMALTDQPHVCWTALADLRLLLQVAAATRGKMRRDISRLACEE
jgi:hypothetical protein